jgi:hypothetical protein
LLLVSLYFIFTNINHKLSGMKKIIFTLLLSGNIAFAQVDLTQGLAAYYPFNGNANDASGNNNNPSFNNATLTTDRFGNANSAYHFNGINNYIDIPNSNSINFGNQISMCAWVRPTGFYYGLCHGNMMISKGDYTDPGYYNLSYDDNLYTNSNNCNGSLPDTLHETFGGTLAPEATPYIIPGQWYSVVYTNDGDTIRIYINCQLRVVYPSSVTGFKNAFDLFFGENSDNNTNYPYWFNGDLDEVRIYNRALNQDEVNTYGGCPLSIPCNNWLLLQGDTDAVTVGNLNVTGDQLTVEASFNTTAYSRFLVSKHSEPSDVNYSLLPDGAEINAGGVYYGLFTTCQWVNNKTYHVASVYDGKIFKFYRDGFLLDSVAASGPLATNNYETHLGYLASEILPQQLYGYLNEVRIWNVARPQDSIRAYMNASLPNPTTQPGLLGYYTFDNLLNKQGNAAYDGTLHGTTSSINNTNPDCDFVADSCDMVTPVTLTSFNASVINNKQVQLNWHTEQETGIQTYIIERAIAGTQNFIAIGTVYAKTNQLSNNYSFIDNTAQPNVLYTYRLAINESTGSRKYSVTRNAKILVNDFYATIYPNPSDGHINLFINHLAGTANIGVFNNIGQAVLNKTITAATSSQVVLDISKQPKGSYWISIQTDETKLVKKVIVQ